MSKGRTERTAPPERGRGREPPRIWLLDTNALLLPFREHFPLETAADRAIPGIELVVPNSALSELEQLQHDRVPLASAAIELARRFRTVTAEGRGDDAVLALARRLDAGVITGDRALIDRLGSAGVPVLRPRGRARLELERPPATVKNRSRPIRRVDGRRRSAARGPVDPVR